VRRWFVARADALAARLWRRSCSQNAQPEGFLEDALAAALEVPGVYEQLAARLGWPCPPGSRRVSTQDRLETGRSDLRLTWTSGYQLVFELKAYGPATDEQLSQYVSENVEVIAIAARPMTHRVRGVVASATWTALRRVSWPDAPLSWRQFLVLLDEMEVAMPRLDVQALCGIMGAWDSMSMLKTWSFQASSRVSDLLRPRGLDLFPKSGSRGKKSFKQEYRRMVAWGWPLPWRKDEGFGVLTGLFAGRPELPTLVEGVPDLYLAVHLSPRCELGRLAGADGQLAQAIERWKSLSAGVVREWNPDVWEPIRARTSAVALLQEPDQPTAFVRWFEDRAREWVECEIVDGLVRLRAGTLPAVVDETATAGGPVEEEGE
jgi:hypothetical protein